MRIWCSNTPANNESVGKLLRELQSCAQRAGLHLWLGETAMKGTPAAFVRQGQGRHQLRGMEYRKRTWRRRGHRVAALRESSSHGPPPRRCVRDGASAVPQRAVVAPAPVWRRGRAGGGCRWPAANHAGPPDPGSGGYPATGGNHFGRHLRRRWRHQVAAQPAESTPTSPLNLIGKIEGWGIRARPPRCGGVHQGPSATGAQLKELLLEPARRHDLRAEP